MTSRLADSRRRDAARDRGVDELEPRLAATRAAQRARPARVRSCSCPRAPPRAARRRAAPRRRDTLSTASAVREHRDTTRRDAATSAAMSHTVADAARRRRTPPAARGAVVDEEREAGAGDVGRHRPAHRAQDRRNRRHPPRRDQGATSLAGIGCAPTRAQYSLAITRSSAGNSVMTLAPSAVHDDLLLDAGRRRPSADGRPRLEREDHPLLELHRALERVQPADDRALVQVQTEAVPELERERLHLVGEAELLRLRPQARRSGRCRRRA